MKMSGKTIMGSNSFEEFLMLHGILIVVKIKYGKYVSNSGLIEQILLLSGDQNIFRFARAYLLPGLYTSMVIIMGKEGLERSFAHLDER